MPLVIPSTGPVQYVQHEGVLAEILGHSNFDGENWAVGDRLIFEDGTESKIKQEPGESVFVWDEPTPADLEEVKRVLGLPEAQSWSDIFATIKNRPKPSSCAAPAAILLALAVILLAAFGRREPSASQIGRTISGSLVMPSSDAFRDTAETRSRRPN